MSIMSKRKTLSAINYYGKWHNKTPKVPKRKRFKFKSKVQKLRLYVNLLDSSFKMCKYYSDNINNNIDLKESRIQGQLALKHLCSQIEFSRNLLEQIQNNDNFSESNRKTLYYISKKINYYQKFIDK